MDRERDSPVHRRARQDASGDGGVRRNSRRIAVVR